MEQTVCHMGVCGKCWAVKYIIIGTVIVLTLVWSRDNMLRALYNLAMVSGLILVFKGLLIMTRPSGCGHCEARQEAKKARK